MYIYIGGTVPAGACPTFFGGGDLGGPSTYVCIYIYIYICSYKQMCLYTSLSLSIYIYIYNIHLGLINPSY